MDKQPEQGPINTTRPFGFGGGWYIIFGAILWGTTGTAQTFVPEGTSPLTVGAVRLVFGTFVLALLAYFRGDLADLHNWRTWSKHHTIMAAISIAAYQIFFFSGVAKTGVAVGTVVGIGSTPIAAGILGFLLRGERPGRHWYAATFLALCGCVVLFLGGKDLEIDPLGVLLSILAGTAYATYTLFSKDLLDNHPPGAVLTVTFFLGCILLLPIYMGGDFSWVKEPEGLIVTLHLGIITVGFAYLLYAKGLQTVSVATAATLTLAEPLTAGLLGVLVVGEQLSLQSISGILLIISGLIVLATQKPSTNYNDEILLETNSAENDY